MNGNYVPNNILGPPRASYETLEDAKLALHKWATKQEDPEEALRFALEVFGFIAPPDRQCPRCEGYYPPGHFRENYSGKLRPHCQRCRSRFV